MNLERALDAGITAATLLHPWNRELCQTEDVISAPDWPGLAQKLDRVSRKRAAQSVRRTSRPARIAPRGMPSDEGRAATLTLRTGSPSSSGGRPTPEPAAEP